MIGIVSYVIFYVPPREKMLRIRTVVRNAYHPYTNPIRIYVFFLYDRCTVPCTTPYTAPFTVCVYMHRIPFIYRFYILLRIHMNVIPIVYGPYKVFVRIDMNNIRRRIRYRIRFRSYMLTNGIRAIYDDVYFSYMYERNPYTLPYTIGIPFMYTKLNTETIYERYTVIYARTVYDAVYGVVYGAVYRPYKKLYIRIRLVYVSYNG